MSEDQMEGADASPPTISYAARIAQTVKELESRVTSQEAELSKLRETTPAFPTTPSFDSSERLRQLRSLNKAYESLSSAAPILPATADSPLPGLLALRATHRLIIETKASITRTRPQVHDANERLGNEEANLRDANLIGELLSRRLEELKTEQQQHSSKTPRDIARGLIKELQERKTWYDKETARLGDALEEFISDHLASMLAAEELGGPVIGDVTEIDDDALEAGFSQQGKQRKRKASASDGAKQRRIDQIWGAAGSDDARIDMGRSEKDAAAAEIRSLLEELLQAADEEGSGNSSAAYVKLARESASVRYLVRSKVAQFHPKDAKRLRLIDFGRDLDE
ncbi:MAG: hypothetical protein M4579_001434 [Chaenotheca gracillima]|nr:MAG: hypothetical protein M4579_001434 [Chaenotheca gracillima]